VGGLSPVAATASRPVRKPAVRPARSEQRERRLKCRPGQVEDVRVAASSPTTAESLSETGARIRSVFQRNFRSGETIFDEGQEGEALFVIQSGQVELIRSADAGQRVISRHGPGEFFGEMSVLLGRPRMARAVAVADTCLLQLDRATFEAMCIEQPEIAIRVIQRLAARMIHLEQRLTALGVDDLRRPVVRVLMRRAQRRGRAARVETQLRALAAEAGLSLVEAHRALSQLMDQRLVRLSDDALLIADLDALSAALDSE
jgi:CRP/FNR family transcriptional regulator, cyclic AMP receptor protein